MSFILVRKLLRDLRWGLLVVGLLLFLFELLHCLFSLLDAEFEDS